MSSVIRDRPRGGNVSVGLSGWPLEVALLGLRRDGAQEIDPHLRCYTNGEEPLVGRYAMWLCKDPRGRGA